MQREPVVTARRCRARCARSTEQRDHRRSVSPFGRATASPPRPAAVVVRPLLSSIRRSSRRVAGLVAIVIEERSGGGFSRRSSSALCGYTERGDRSLARAKPGLPYWRPCQQDATPTMSSSSVPLSPRLPRPSRHPLSLSSRPSPLTPRPGSASVTSSSAPSSAAPADSSPGPCRRPRPSTRAEARNDGAAADEAPWAEEEAGRSSAYGAIAWI